MVNIKALVALLLALAVIGSAQAAQWEYSPINSGKNISQTPISVLGTKKGVIKVDLSPLSTEYDHALERQFKLTVYSICTESGNAVIEANGQAIEAKRYCEKVWLSTYVVSSEVGFDYLDNLFEASVEPVEIKVGALEERFPAKGYLKAKRERLDYLETLRR